MSSSWCCCLDTLRLSLCTLHRPSHLPFHSPDLHLPCGLVRGEIDCALPRMRKALWPATILSTVMSPTSSTTTRSQRPLKSQSRSPPATAGPQTCTTWRSMTAPSAWRSLHHCSLKNEKIQRAVDKAYHSPDEGLSSSVGHVSEQGDLFSMSLDH